MNSMLRIGACTVALAFAASVPALAADDASTTTKTTKHHMHHAMHKGMHGKMAKGSMYEGDAAVAKLNEQSLQQAKEGAAPATSGGAMTPASGGTMGSGTMGAGSTGGGSMGNGAMAPASSGSMAPPASSTSPTAPK